MNPYSAWQVRNGRTTAFRNCWTTISEKAISGSCPRLICAASRSSMRPREAACRKECGPYWKNGTAAGRSGYQKSRKRTSVTMKEGRCPARAYRLRRPHGQGRAPVRRLGPGAAMSGELPAVPCGPVFLPRTSRAGETGDIPFQHIR